MSAKVRIIDNGKLLTSTVQSAGAQLSGMSVSVADPAWRKVVLTQKRLLRAAMGDAAKQLTLDTRQTAREVVGSDQKPRYGRPHGQPTGPTQGDTDGGVIHLPRMIRWRRWESQELIAGRMQTTGTADVYAASLEFGHQKVLWGQRTSDRVGGAGKNIRRSFWRSTIDRTRSKIDAMVLTALKRKIGEHQRR